MEKDLSHSRRTSTAVCAALGQNFEMQFFFETKLLVLDTASFVSKSPIRLLSVTQYQMISTDG